MIDLLIVMVAAVLGALWRRWYGGWKPAGMDTPKLLKLVVMAALTGALGFLLVTPGLALAGPMIAYSFTPAHGQDSNRFAALQNDWIEQALRYGIFSGLGVGAVFAVFGYAASAVVMLIGAVAAGIGSAFFTNYGDRLTWLPVDPAPASIVDGRQVYNEFWLGMLVVGSFALACAIA